MITLKSITPQKQPVFKDEVFFGWVHNEYELNDLRIQIAKEKATGYSIVFTRGEEDIIIIINPDGNLSDWPRGFYDTVEQQLVELFKIRMKRDDKLSTIRT